MTALGIETAALGRHCEIVGEDRLPRFDVIFDAEAVERVSRSLPQKGSVVIGISMDTLGLPSRFRLLEHTLESPALDLLLDSLNATFRGNPGGRRSSHRVRIDVAAPESPSVQVGGSVRCDARLRNQPAVEGMLDRALLHAPRKGTAELLLHIGTEGEVLQARIRKSSGNRRVDALVLQVGNRMEFTPGRLDGEAIRQWVAIPVTLDAPGFPMELVPDEGSPQVYPPRWW